MTRLLALLDDPDGPSARLRFEPFARELERRGAAAVERVAIPPAGPARWRLFGRGNGFDVVFVQRRLLLPWESAWLRRRARRLVADVDDALWRRDHPPFESRGRRWKLRALLVRCDAVIAGSATLVDELRGLDVAATPVRTPAESWARAKATAPVGSGARAAGAPPVALWIGQPSTYRYLRELAGEWRRAVGDGARLLIVGAGVAGDPAWERAEFRAWSIAAEQAALTEATIALAPLPDDPWTRGKCGARLTSYLAAGVPSVASPVGAQRELAEQVGGVEVAGAPREFARAAARLLAEPGRRGALAAGLAERAAAELSVARGWRDFTRALLGSAGEDPSGAALVAAAAPRG